MGVQQLEGNTVCSTPVCQGHLLKKDSFIEALKFLCYIKLTFLFFQPNIFGTLS
jgi:hypothetical protein